MDTIDLGFQTPDYSKSDGATSPMGGKKMPTKTAYPSLTIPGNKALARSLDVGQEFTATVTFRVSEIAIRERDGDSDEDAVIGYGDGTRVELEAQSIAMDGVKMEQDEADGEDGASALKKFISKKRQTQGDDSEED